VPAGSDIPAPATPARRRADRGRGHRPVAGGQASTARHPGG